MLAESCRQAARWRANGPRTLPPTMHINLSPRQFAEPHLVDLFARPETASRVGELLGHDRRWQ